MGAAWLLALAAAAAWAASPDPVELRLSAASKLIEAGRYEGAENSLKEAEVLLDPRHPLQVRLLERRGALLLRQDKVVEARETFTRAIQTAKLLKVEGQDVARAFAGLGLCLMRQENKPYALKAFKRALELAPDEGTALFAEDQVAALEGRPPKPLR